MTSQTTNTDRVYISQQFPDEAPKYQWQRVIALSPISPKSLAMTWEDERDACMDGQILKGCGYGCLSRIKHLGSCAFNVPIELTFSALSSLGSVLIGAFGPLCCLSGTVCGIMGNPDELGTGAVEAAGAVCEISSMYGLLSGLHLGDAMLKTVRFPMNLFAPEAMSGLCYQHWCDLKMAENFQSTGDKLDELNNKID